MKKENIKAVTVVFSVVLAAVVIFSVLVRNGVIIPNNIFADEYSVRGVDVSSYQGDIDWETLSAQNISFAFIKATEGSSFVDEYFAYNYENAQKTSLAVGAYHFFSYDSPGQTQAENYINTVEPFDGMLPPVIDIEFYGDKEKNPPERAEVEVQLKNLLDALEKHYGLKPIIYATEKLYELYLSNDFEDYDIWIRNVLTKPTLPDGRAWTFWQYTDRATLDGYNGEEKYIDLNVFFGTEEEFASYRIYKESP